jgi:hypothetical protein
LKIIDLVKFDFILYPDNIATPIAASMGDICTITILALISDFLFKLSEENQWLSGTALFVIVCATNGIHSKKKSLHKVSDSVGLGTNFGCSYYRTTQRYSHG